MVPISLSTGSACIPIPIHIMSALRMLPSLAATNMWDETTMDSLGGVVDFRAEEEVLGWSNGNQPETADATLPPPFEVYLEHQSWLREPPARRSLWIRAILEDGDKRPPMLQEVALDINPSSILGIWDHVNDREFDYEFVDGHGVVVEIASPAPVETYHPKHICGQVARPRQRPVPKITRRGKNGKPGGKKRKRKRGHRC